MKQAKTDPYMMIAQAKGDSATDSSRTWFENSLDALVSLPRRAILELPLIGEGVREAQRIEITQKDIALKGLPATFEGIKVAFLTDLHCSKLNPPEFLEQAVRETNRLRPDVVLLGGDYVDRGTAYIRPMAQALARLKAPLGLYGVLGNHDHVSGPAAVRAGLKQAGIVDVTNAGRWLTVGGSRIRIAGVGDLWWDKQDESAALEGAAEDEAVILLSHNPDYAMKIKDRRVRLILSGHTHGGQIRLPWVGALYTNSRYGQRLVSGLVSFDSFQLYVSRGVGAAMIPFRYHCPPEIVLLTLQRS